MTKSIMKIIRFNIKANISGNFEGSFMYIKAVSDIMIGNMKVFTVKRHYRYTIPYSSIKYKDTAKFTQNINKEFESLKYEYFDKINFFEYLMNINTKLN